MKNVMFMVVALVAMSPQPFPGSAGHGIGFDDLGFAPSLRKVMVPGGNTGKLGLIDPNAQVIPVAMAKASLPPTLATV